MTGILAAFKALSLEAQTEAYRQITAAFNARKDARRLQLEAEIRALGFKPGEGKKIWLLYRDVAVCAKASALNSVTARTIADLICYPFVERARTIHMGSPC
jgi:hypothetical protein